MDLDDAALSETPSLSTADSAVPTAFTRALPLLPPNLVALRQRFETSSTARAMSISIPARPGEALSSGTLIVPGWIRARMAEDLFAYETMTGSAGEAGLTEEKSVVEAVLLTLSKVGSPVSGAESSVADLVAMSRSPSICESL